jgi:phage terminase large subunit GpA-like protein
VPYAREIMDVLSPSDPTQEVTFVAGTQVAKTEIGNNFIGYIIDVAPGPAMMVYPTSNTGKRSSRTRLAKMIEATPGCARRSARSSRDKSNSASLKEFPAACWRSPARTARPSSSRCRCATSSRTRSTSIPTTSTARGRPTSSPRSAPTPSSAQEDLPHLDADEKGRSKIWRHFERRTCAGYHVPCPHCAAPSRCCAGTQMRWETRKVWEVVRADDGEIVEVPAGTEGAKARDTGEVLDVWYECAHCTARASTSTRRPGCSSAGRWIAEAPWVKGTRRLPPLGALLAGRLVLVDHGGEEAPRGGQGSVEEAAQDLDQHRRRRAVRGRGDKVSDLVLKERAENYKLGTVPRGALLLTASVDVQAEAPRGEGEGLGPREGELARRLPGDPRRHRDLAPWDALDEYHQRKFPHESGATLRITAMAVDSGYRTQVVYDWCRRRAHRHIFAVKGSRSRASACSARRPKQDIDHNGEKIPGGVKLWPIGADTAKEEIYTRLKIEQPGPGYMHFPLGLPDDYYSGLVAESQVTKYVKGYLRHVWEKTETERNEPLDLEVYAYAAAIYAGVLRINWDRSRRRCSPPPAISSSASTRICSWSCSVSRT